MTGNTIRCHIKELKKKVGSNATTSNSAPTTPNKPIKGGRASAGNTSRCSVPARKRAKPIIESDTDSEIKDVDAEL